MSEKERRVTASAEETERLAAALAADLGPGDVVLVTGELGSGKTTFVRGAARALGVSEPVTSPTFTIGHRYSGRDGLAVSHLDLYRLGGLDDEDPALLEDYLTEDAISFVEWPELAGDRLGEVALEVGLAHAGDDRREVSVRRWR